MKRFFLLFTLIASLVAYAQDKPLSYSEVIPVDGKTQAEIFGGLREWVATSYVSGKAVTQLEDATTGIIILKSFFPFEKGGVYSSYTGTVDYMLKLQAKDGRYRVEMNQMVHSVRKGNYERSNLGLITTAEKINKGGLEKGANNKIWREIKDKSAAQFSKLVESLKNITTFAATEEEEW